MENAKSRRWMLCHHCHKLNEANDDEHQRCCRCRAPIHMRQPHSLEYTWALTIAAIIAFIPANVLPIMTISYFGSGSPNTVLSGIATLIKLEMYPVALIVFIASFMVPLGKIAGLIILMLSIQRPLNIDPKQRILLYRLVDFLGKWSMLDVFVVAIMAAVVQLGFISEIIAGPGATAFAIMVILTMFAAHTFDPRLIWDKEQQ